MRVDIYRRAEYSGKFVFLAVPEGKIIPGEVTNTDWAAAAQRVELPDSATEMAEYGIGDPLAQIAEKGYAITALDAEVRPH